MHIVTGQCKSSLLSTLSNVWYFYYNIKLCVYLRHSEICSWLAYDKTKLHLWGYLLLKFSVEKLNIRPNNYCIQNYDARIIFLTFYWLKLITFYVLNFSLSYMRINHTVHIYITVGLYGQTVDNCKSIFLRMVMRYFKATTWALLH